ncbi:hypothetical protein KGF41_00005, partial [Clostridioides sp. ZZV14-6150]|uniref:hypothetical protein n=1 Tax=Clostridioides sp. ZZV14-6150 TaxID=2811493 RepID=UPI001D12DC12|nr:hypothetical protein [Clostridioides sp. ZZV14-6150]
MLNEDVVKNINKLNNEQDNINLELSNKVNKEDLDKLIQGGTNIATSKLIVQDDWTLEEDNYKTLVEHNLITRKILVNIIDTATNESILASYKIIDDNKIELFNESNVNCECVVVNGNSAINVVTANKITVDDIANNFESSTVEGALGELFQFVSDGKKLIATAITDKKVPTNSSDTFPTMASNISNIKQIPDMHDDVEEIWQFT